MQKFIYAFVFLLIVQSIITIGLLSQEQSASNLKLIGQTNIKNNIPMTAAKSELNPKALARKILSSLDNSMYPKIFKSTMKMITYRRNRTPLDYNYMVYSKGNDHSRMEIIAPAREKGKKILIVKDNLWMYIPLVSRPIRLSRKDSFMGSTFSNEDLLNSSFSADYDPDIIEQKGNLYLLNLKAKRLEVAYAQINIWVDEETDIPTEATYYGLSGKAIKKMYFSDIKKIANRLRPLKMKMVDLLEEESYTEVVMITLDELESLPDYMFDQTQLGR